MLKLFWITFAGAEPGPLGLGCGVTAASDEEAFALIERDVFSQFGRFEISSISPVERIEDLDQSHVVPNMRLFFQRGIWFP